MKMICRSNCSGKTTGIPILALTQRKEQSLKEKSVAYFGEIVKTISYEEAQTYKGKVLLDDVEKVLDTLVKCTFKNSDIQVEGIAMSA